MKSRAGRQKQRGTEKWKANETWLQWTPRESYKVNKLLSRETRFHLNIQLSLLSQSMKDVFISIPITSLRFISITWACSLEPANCSTKQCQWHFKGSQRVFDGILMLSGFGGFQSGAWWAGGFEVRQQWQNVTYPSSPPAPQRTIPLSSQRRLRGEKTVQNMD